MALLSLPEVDLEGGSRCPTPPPSFLNFDWLCCFYPVLYKRFQNMAQKSWQRAASRFALMMCAGTESTTPPPPFPTEFLDPPQITGNDRDCMQPHSTYYLFLLHHSHFSSLSSSHSHDPHNLDNSFSSKFCSPVSFSLLPLSVRFVISLLLAGVDVCNRYGKRTACHKLLNIWAELDSAEIYEK